MTEFRRKRRKFILVPSGSAGENRPFLWLAQGLKARGHDVTAVVHAPFGQLFHAERIQAAVYGTAEDYEAILRHPDLWHPRRGFALLARNAERTYRHVVPLIREEAAPGRTTLVGAGLAFGARIAAEVDRLPIATIQLQPAAFLSVESPPLLRAGWERFARSPRWLRPAVYALADWHTDWLLAGALNEYRAELGLSPPVRRVFQHYALSPKRVVALFPEWFAPKQRDWPPQSATTRFPLDEQAPAPPLPGPIDEFVSDGECPILFTAGSDNIQAASFLSTAVEVSLRLGRRAVLIVPRQDLAPPHLPKTVRAFASTPFRGLFPRCAAVVHSGEIGTVAEAFLAGVPQLVVAMSHDQPDNGARVQQAGVGEYLYPRQFDGTEGAVRLRRLLESSEVAAKCRDYRRRMVNPIPPERVFEMLEDLR